MADGSCAGDAAAGGPAGAVAPTATPAAATPAYGLQQHAAVAVAAVAAAADDCRKKRCVDRYDSSESSDSGVAVLSCTDCSGSSTASSDIADPGSPFSTASSHSDSDSQQATAAPPPAPPPRMPPVAAAAAAWPWAGEATAPLPKRARADAGRQQPPAAAAAGRMQQGKITEYFKSQVKPNNGAKKEAAKKFANLVDQQTQFNSLKTQPQRKEPRVSANGAKKKPFESKRSVPRKILPAPSKLTEKISIAQPPMSFGPAVTLTAVGFPSNLAYLHTKAPKPPDNPIFVPQFIANDKLNTIPIINRTQCLNVIQPINNFNCMKLNATMVPIVKLNTLPARLNGAGLANVALSVETAVPTVLAAQPKQPLIPAMTTTPPAAAGKAHAAPVVVASGQQCRSEETRTEEPYRTEECSGKSREGCQRSEPILAAPSSPSGSSDDSGMGGTQSDRLTDSATPTPPEATPAAPPILSQPRTIRFPPAKKREEEDRDAKEDKDATRRCRWDGCEARFDASGALHEHLQVHHVISQTDKEHYVCLWGGCKVHGRTSCSRSWLERHVLAHAGTKPFRCIVDGCGHRFNSQLMLERHVNNHFNSDGSQNSSAKKTTDNGSVKLFKRNGRIIRFRRQPWSARMFDFIDSGIMEGLQHRLLQMTQKRTMGSIGNAGDCVTLQSQVLARRLEADGSTKFLLRWHPADVVPDEWVSEKEYAAERLVPIPHLAPAAKEALGPALFPPDQVRTKRSRKQAPRPRPT